MRLAAAAIGLSIALTGCSLFTARPPDPDRAAGEVPVCNPAKGSVGLDGTMAVLFGLGAVVAFAADEPGTGLGLGLASVAYGGSAYHGSRSANRCREALSAYEDEDAQRDLRFAAPERAVPAPTPTDPYPEAEADAEPAPEPEREAAPEPVAEADWPDFWRVVP